MLQEGMIHLGNCVDIINEAHESWADLILSGPSIYGGNDKEQDDREAEWFLVMHKALTKTGTLFIVGPMGWILKKSTMLAHIYKQYPDFHIQHVSIIRCHRTKANFSSEAVLVATKELPGIRKPFDSYFETLTHPDSSSSGHLEIYERAIKTYTKKGDLVFDPFEGFGTTPVAAINTHRRWVGCEMEQKQIDASWNRIERETCHTRPQLNT